MIKNIEINSNTKESDFKFLDEMMLKNLQPNNDENNDSYKALGKIRLEDLQLQECISELEKKIKELAQEKNKFVFQEHENDVKPEDKYQNDQNLKLEELIVDQEQQVKKSIIQKILDFLEEFYLEIDNVNVNNIEFFRFKKKQSFIESMISFLKKCLLQGNAINIKQLLEQQIRELELELDKELNPALHKLIQERLLLLRQIHMIGLKSGLNADTFLKFLLISSISNLAIDVQKQLIYDKEDKNFSQDHISRNEKSNVHNREKVSHASDNHYEYSISNISIINNDIPGVYIGKINVISYKKNDYFLNHSLHSENVLQFQEITVQKFIKQVLDFFAIKLQTIADMLYLNHPLGDVKIAKASHNIYDNKVSCNILHSDYIVHNNYLYDMNKYHVNYNNKDVNHTSSAHMHGCTCCSLLEEVRIDCVQIQANQKNVVVM
ncbi:hypothetical protein IAH97_03815 [Neoehrlichia mikurensis]|uniref:Uncharacterized protein n=1 Tax=Neoehrlichia mikurensis TaxID=89586 RepID=A0A9Q9BSB0_9RICK|nr:hypothetical protein [Neoehrlichia mikurensis]QXK91856.1 hypothetical protein IAH97_03815 [Neoehrlichia mikurensis]UTO55495.1 hypothetical protein LUA82_00115 [Neoehrlichia mikurensis]UTO56417.1 hypothetical protein LUA81_00120 [Neoehrlichia mikurensis]